MKMRTVELTIISLVLSWSTGSRYTSSNTQEKIGFFQLLSELERADAKLLPNVRPIVVGPSVYLWTYDPQKIFPISPAGDFTLNYYFYQTIKRPTVRIC
jgi:hypothetical protein